MQISLQVAVSDQEVTSPVKPAVIGYAIAVACLAAANFLPGQHAGNTRGACRGLVESRYAADAGVRLSNFASHKCDCVA